LFQSNFNSDVPRASHEDISYNTLWLALERETQNNGYREPTKSEILLQLGILYWRREEFDRSEQLITKAHEVLEDDKNICFLAQCFIGLALVKNSLEKIDEAIVAYQQASTLTPENIHLWNNLGRLYTKQNLNEKALYAFRKALKIDPHDRVAWTGIANTYYQNGSIEEAIKAYKQVVCLMQNINTDYSNTSLWNSEFNRQLVLPWLRLAVLFTKKYQYQKAVDAYKKVIAFDAENAEIWQEIGVLYIKMESYEEAVEALLNAIDCNPKYGKAYLGIGVAYKKLGKYQDSVTFFLKSINLLQNPQEKQLAQELMENAINALRELRTVRTTEKPDYLRASVPFQSEASWFYYKYNEEMISINFSFPVDGTEQLVTRTAGKCKSSSEKQQINKGEREMSPILPFPSTKRTQVKIKTISSYSQNMKAESADPKLWNEKGNIHFNNMAYEEAINAYTIAIELDPAFGQPYHNLALIHLIMGNLNEAVLHYRRSISLLTTDREKAIAWNGLGNVYRRVKDYESARIAYQNASALDKQNGGVYDSTNIFEVSGEVKTADFWNDLGKLFFKTGAYNKAASAFQKAIQLEPSSGHAHSHLARALTAQGQYKEAVSLYRKSIDLISNEKEKANAWNRLGDVHRKLNDYDNALKAYQNATALTNDKVSLLSRTRFSLLSNCTTH